MVPSLHAMNLNMHPTHPVRAFSLSELLASLAIIAVLVAIIGVAITKAKRRSASVVCTSNQHQIGLLLNLFVAETHEYPLFLNGSSSNDLNSAHSATWLRSLKRTGGFHEFMESEKTAFFRCPNGKEPSWGWPDNRGYAAYGYNADGIVSSANDRPLGLGGKGSEDLYSPPVKESEVSVPSEMIAIGDSFIAWDNVVLDGSHKIGLKVGVQDVAGSTARSLKRHDGSGIYLFADGHVASLPMQSLLLAPDMGLRKLWNRDNEPHMDRKH